METFRFKRYCGDLDESVYPRCAPPPVYRYRSRFAKKVRVDRWCQKSGCYKTMGAPRGVHCERPELFLKKHSRVPPVYFDPEVLNNPNADVKKDQQCNVRRQSSEERRIRLGVFPKPPKIPTCPKDFLMENALRVIQLPPRRLRRCYLGEDGSHRVDLTDGPFTLQPGFGEVPCYIKHRKYQLCQEAMEMKRRMEEAQVPPHSRLMGRWERCSLINGLKARWETLQLEFLRLPTTASDWVDEAKGKLESQLKQLEADLRLLTSNYTIYVSNTGQRSQY